VTFSTLKGRVCMHLALLALALLFGANAASAQVATAGLYGEVTDPQGAAVVGAKVTVTHAGTGATRTAETDNVGRYQFLALSPGRYNLKIEMQGFRTSLRERLDLQVNTTSKLNVEMELGALAETVVVSEAAALINTSDASIGNVIGENQIRQLPLEARNVVGLLSLQPGAVFLPTGDQRSGAISGARSDQANVTMDGVDVNDPQFQTAYTSVLRATLDSVQEFRVTTSNYGADQGRSSSAQVALVTKSGTNEVHGSGYWYHRNTVTSANEYFLKLAQGNQSPPINKAPKLQKHIFGASAGAPLLKDRLFIFGNFENLRSASEASVDRAIPSNSFRDGVLIYQCASAGACPGGTVQGFNNSHTIPAGFFGLRPAQLAAIDPLAIGPSALASTHFRQYPTPNDTGRDGQLVGGQIIGNIVGFRFNSPITNTFWTYIARLDFKVDRTGNHAVFVRGNMQDDVIGGASQFPGQPANSLSLINSKGLAVGYNAVLTPRLVNVFRYGITRISEETAGLLRDNQVTFRFISDLPATTSTNGRIVPTHNIVDDMTYTVGAHTWQWGINFRWTRIPRFSNANSFHFAVTNGSWVPGVGRTFMPGGPDCTTPGCSAVPAVSSGGEAVYADSFINILGIVSQASARYNYNTDGSVVAPGTPIARRYGSDEYEWYIQDTWRLKPNLTFTLGVRHSLYSPPWETEGRQVGPTTSLGELFIQRGLNMRKGIPNNALPPIQIDLAGKANNRKGFYAFDYNNFGPRASFAWTPRFTGGWLGWLTGDGRKMVIRGGYSLVYDRIGHGLATQFDSAGSFGLSTSLTSPFGAFGEDAPFLRFQGLNVMPSHLPAAPPGGFPQTPPLQAGIITQSIDDTITTPFAQAVNFSIGREMPWSMALEFSYVGRRGENLLTRRDLAMALDLVDPASGVSYFNAAQQVIRATQAAGIPRGAANAAYTVLSNIPYWENLFPDAAFSGLTATQQIARRFNRDSPDFITSLWLLDQFCFPACSRFGPFAYFNEQYDSLAAQSSIGRSNYDALQITLRKKPSYGLQFDFNYTMSKSLDLGSAVERGSSFTTFFPGGYTGFLLNSWEPNLHYGQSDFDVRQQMNLNWVYDLPIGRGRWLGGDTPGWADQIIGGWSFSGLWRLTSGFPFSVINCRSCWPTNWNLQGNASLATPGVFPELATVKNKVGGRPSMFKDPADAITKFRRSLPGEVGLRNAMRGDGYFVLDFGVGKSWRMPWLEGHQLKFRWETFNVTNTPKFDTGSITAFPDISSSFGRYNNTLATCDGFAGRCMQFAFRYEW